MTFAAIQNRLGVQPVGTTVTCVNKSGTSVAIGDLVITSFIHAGAVVDPQQAANTGYVFNCIRKAVSTETGNTGYLGVVTGLMAGAGANGREVEVQFGGICQAKVLVNATVSSGTLLSVSATAGVLSNAPSTSEYSVTLMDAAAVADGIALKRVYIPQEYSFNATTPQNQLVYGNTRAGQFLSDLAAGADSLDVVIIGDSNTGSSQGGMWGYHNGFSQAMFELGWLCYGTHYSHLMSDWLVNTNTGGWNSSAFVNQPTGTLFNGNISGGSTAYSTWTPGKGVTNVTISNASPGVVTYTGHGLTAGAPVFLDTTGLLPAGLSATITGIAITNTTGNFSCTAVSQGLAVGQPVTISGTFTNGNSISGYSNPTTYYIIAANSASTTFQLSATRNGAAVTTVVGTAGVGAVFNVSNTGYTYFVNTVLTPDTFTLALSPTGSAINTSSAGSGTHTIQTCPWTRYGSATAKSPAKDSWAYINGAEYWSPYPQIFMNAAHPLCNASLTLWHRIRWGSFNTGSGYFRPYTRLFTGSVLATSPVINTNTGNANSFQMSEYSFASTVPTGGDQIEAAPFGGNGTAGVSRGAVGPVAVHGNSIYCKRKGWSVTSHGYLAGYDSLMINQIATTIGLTLQLHLQELRERQISAGGTGRVLIVSHSGINGDETASAWTSSHVSIWNTYKAAWAALGYPANDLAIVSFVGVAKDAADNSNNGTGGNLIAVRAAANALPSTYPDMTVVDVNKFMPYTRAIVGIGNGRSYYQRTNNLPNAGSDITVHLSGGISGGTTKDTSDGYTVVSHTLISALLATV